MFKCRKNKKIKQRVLALVLSLWIFPTSARLDRKSMPETNTLAYYEPSSICGRKKFYNIVPRMRNVVSDGSRFLSGGVGQHDDGQRRGDKTEGFTREPWLNGKALYDSPPSFKKVENVCFFKRSCFKLVSTRRSIVLSHPLQKGFSGFCFNINKLACFENTTL
jgi:hypothetical protein